MGKKAKARRMRTIRLVVIPEPKPGTRSVLNYTGKGTLVMRGDTSPGTTMVCGKCEAPLIEGVGMDQIVDIVFHCNRCGAYNQTLAIT
jgi:hypothetical protein